MFKFWRRLERPCLIVHPGTSSTNLNPPSSAPDTLHRTLSRFQVEKFSYMFGALFDLERNGLIEEGDMRALADKMAGYAGWGREEGEDGQEVTVECYSMLLVGK